MSGSLFSDNAIRSAKLALDGLSMKQGVISNNIANVDTPGYRAQEVDFDNVMKRALNNSGESCPGRKPIQIIWASPTEKPYSEFKTHQEVSSRADGNNVDIDTELMEMSLTGIQYQAVSQELSKKLSLLKTIASR